MSAALIFSSARRCAADLVCACSLRNISYIAYDRHSMTITMQSYVFVYV